MEYVIVLWEIIKFLIIAAFAYFLFEQLFVALYLVIDLLNRNKQDPTNEPIKINIVIFIKNLILEAWYVIAKVFLWPLKFKNLSLNQELIPTTDRIIVLVHGYARSQIDWLWLRTKLTTKYPVILVNLTPRFGSILDIAAQLDKDLQPILTQNPNAKISFIGHSMGGIVSTYYSLHYLHNKYNIAHIISIGSPWHGTKLAVLGKGANMRQLEIGSEFLSSLRATITPLKDKLYCIASTHDNLIFPWQSAILNNELIIDHMISTTSHLGLINSKSTLIKLKQWLELE